MVLYISNTGMLEGWLYGTFKRCHQSPHQTQWPARLPESSVSLAAQNRKPWVLALQIKRSKQSLLPAAISPLPGSILSVSRLFASVVIDGEERTAIRLIVEQR